MVSNANDSGAGSLRQAILDSEANATDDRILFVGGLTSPITLESALPTLTKTLTITGPGADVLRVRRNPAAATSFRIIDVGTTGNVTIEALEISGGATSGGTSTDAGAGVRNYRRRRGGQRV